jgi:tetratricopeptide (TPR) repeat protein
MRISAFLVTAIALLSSACSHNSEQYIKTGQRLLAEKRLDDAAIHFRKALQKQPNDPLAQFYLGVVAREQRNLRLAFSLFASAANQNPRFLDAYMALGEVAADLYTSEPSVNKSLYEAMTRAVNVVSKAEPNSIRALTLQARKAIIDRNYRNAVDLLMNAAKQSKDDENVHAQLVNALFLSQQGAEGEKQALSWLSDHPSSGPMYDSLYSYYVVTDRSNEARRIIESKAAANPKNVAYVLQLASVYVIANDLSASEALFAQMERDAITPDVQLVAGDIYMKYRRLASAAEHFERGISSLSSVDKSLYRKRLAAVQWLQGNKAQAIETIKTVTAEKPQDEEARRMRASFLLDIGSQGEIESVITDYSDLLKKSSDNPVLAYQLGRAYRVKRDNATAVRYFHEALRKSPSHLGAKLGLAEINAEEGKYEEALRYIDEVLSIDSKNHRIRLFRAATLRNLHREQECRRELGKLLQLGGADSYDAKVELGLLSLATQKYGEAEEIFGKLVQEKHSDVRPSAGLAEAYAGQKRFEKALNVLDRAAERSGKDSLGLRMRIADLAARAGKVSIAVEQLKRAVALDPNSAGAKVRLGEMLIADAKVAEGLNVLRAAVAAAPEQGFARVVLAAALFESGETAEACNVAEKAVSASPGDPLRQNNLAYMYAKLGNRLEEALKMAQAATQAAPQNPTFQDTLALVYINGNQPDRGVRIARQLIHKYPNNPEYRLRLATGLVRTGERKEARDSVRMLQKMRLSASQKTAMAEIQRSLG